MAIPACYASGTAFCVSRGGLDRVYIKVDVEERQKRLKNWLKRNVIVE